MDSATPPPTIEALLAHREWVRRVALCLVRDESLADDVEQQTWLAALAHPPRTDASPRGWLGTVARNAARRLRRSASRRAAHETVAPPPRAARDPADLIAEAEIHHRVSEAVLALEEPYRTTVLQRFVDGLEPGEIAARSGVPMETVRTRIRRALDRLRDRLDREHPADRRAWLVALLAERSADPPVHARSSPPLALGGTLLMTAKTHAAIVAAVVLLAALAGWRATSPGGVREQASGVSDADGGGGAAAARAPASPRARPTTTAPARVPAAAGAEAGCDHLDLDRDRDAHGVVVTPDGVPVAGATVTAVDRPWRTIDPLDPERWRDETTGPATVTDGRGAFALRLSPGSERWLRIVAPGAAEVEVPGVQAGARVRVVVDAGVRLRVAVAGSDGRPVPGASLRLFRAHVGGPEFQRAGTTGADGQVVLDAAPARTWAWLVTEAEGHGSDPWLKVTLGAPGEQRIDVRLPAGRTVRVAVTDAATGRPVAGAVVGRDWTFARPTVTDADGRASLTGWTETQGPSVYARAPGHAAAFVRVGAADDVTIALPPETTIRGRAVTEDATPIADARVAARGERGDDEGGVLSGATATTAADGTFTLRGLHPGVPHRVRIEAGERGTAVLAVPAADAAAVAEIDLGAVLVAEGLLLEGSVRDEEDRPIPDVLVRVHTHAAARGPLDAELPTPTYTRRTDDLGRFRVAGLPPGRYDVGADVPGGAHAEAQVVGQAGSPVPRVDFRLPTGRSLAVRVTGPDGGPVSAARAMLRRDGEILVQAHADAAGVVLLRADPGTYDLEVRPFDVGTLLPASRIVTIADDAAAAAAAPCDVQLEQGFAVAGTVLDADGRRIDGADVSVVRAGVELASTLTSGEGTFRCVVPGAAPVDVVFDGRVFRRDDEREVRTPHDALLSARAASVRPGGDAVVLRGVPVATDRALTVRVADDAGRPASGVLVVVRSPGFPERRTASTDVHGEAQFAGLPRRPLVVNAQGTGERFDAEPVVCGPDAALADASLRRAARISGTVVLPDGRGVPAEVRAFAGEVEFGGHEAGEDGAFEIRVPAGGSPFLRVVATTGAGGRDFEGVVSGVAPGAADVRVVIAPR